MTLDRIDTLIELLAYRAARTPRQIAYIFAGGSCTYEDLWAGANRFASALLAMGLERRERLLLVLPNSLEFFFAFYGVQRAGGIAVPIFPGFGPERILAMAGLCGARRIVVPSNTPAGRREAFTALARARGLAVITVAASAAQPVPASSFPAIQAEDIAFLQYTSGSTGDPKGVQLSHANLISNVRQMIAGMEITQEDVFVSWLPVYHDMGLILKTMTPLYLGARAVLLPTDLSHVGRWLQAIQQHRGTFTAAPDFAYRLCLRHIQQPGQYDLSSLRVALNAAEPVRAGTIAAFHRAFALENVMVAGYGLAEATVGVSMWQPGTTNRVDARGNVSVGRPFPQIEVHILGEEGPLPAGEIGEIVVRSPANTRGYFENPEATARLFWREDAIRTGDLGYLDEQGHLYIAGRKKNTIIQAGRTLYPQDIQEVVDAVPGVRYSAAVGIDRGGIEGEQTYVFAEIRGDETTAETALQDLIVQIVTRVYERLGMRPGRVFLLKAKSIPLTHNGKLRHGHLKQRYLQGELQRSGQILYPRP